MAKEKQFPLEWEARKPIYHYPDEPTTVTGEILEIGPGRGDMLLWLAEQSPEKRFVAIELMVSRYYKLIRRCERRGLVNIRLIRGNARLVLPKYFGSPCFEKIYVLFPDPWPKDRHAFHRLLSVDILNFLGTIMSEGGELIFATDHAPYAEWVIGNVAQVPLFTNLGTPFSSDSSLIPNPDRTYFEKKWRSEGKEIRFVHLQKKTAGQ